LVNYNAPETSAGGRFTVSLGSQTLAGEVKSGTDQTLSLGRVALEPGNFEIRVAATKINGGELFRLRSLELRSVAR
jgi:hypothetical protein